jgi:hypothetical protein
LFEDREGELFSDVVLWSFSNGASLVWSRCTSVIPSDLICSARRWYSNAAGVIGPAATVAARTKTAIDKVQRIVLICTRSASGFENGQFELRWRRKMQIAQVNSLDDIPRRTNDFPEKAEEHEEDGEKVGW